MTAGYDAVDARHRIGPYLVRRARPQDAAAYSRADAEFVSATYADVMPPEFAEHQFADVRAATVRNEARFARDLAAEEAGAEPEHRTWIALDSGRIVAIAISSGLPQAWEAEIGAAPIAGLTRQLDHLYLDRSAWGTGLASGLLELALPDRADAYLWIVEGNDRAQRFYARHGFLGDGRTYACGPSWYHRVLYRMVRRAGE